LDNPFQVYDADHAPLAIGGVPRGLAIQDDFLKLISPEGSTDNRQPIFTWRVNLPNVFSPGDVTSTEIVVSVFPSGEGLFPDDFGKRDTNGGIIDQDPHRTLTKILDPSQITINPDGSFSYQLPSNLELTAGQTYYWGMIVTADGQTSAHKW